LCFFLLINDDGIIVEKPETPVKEGHDEKLGQLDGDAFFR
jgi:hypothetical protein